MAEPEELHPFQDAECPDPPGELDFDALEQDWDEFGLLRAGATDRCPSCGSTELGQEYHQAGHLAGTCGRVYGWPKIARLGPHVDRWCKRCNFPWCEELVYVGD